MFSKLPSSLNVRDVANQGNGIFTKTFIPKGEEIFTSMPYSFGAGGVTVEDVRGSCHHCLKIVRDKTTSVVCKSCKVVGYCSKACLDLAAPLHSMECKGLGELEQYRSTMPKNLMATDIDGRVYWPSLDVLMIARAINRKILQAGNEYDDEWLVYLSNHSISPAMSDRYPLIKWVVRYLVPSHVSDDEIYRMYIAVSINTADVMCPHDTAAAALYFEYSLLNHMCQPNCAFKNDVTTPFIYAVQNIQPGSQLCISYLNPRYRINVREIRRGALKNNYGFDCSCLVCLDEVVVGSKFWALDQQKRSLIAPWSRKLADEIMNDGWEAVCQHESMERLPAIELLESTLARENKVLDKRNIALILTVWRLFRCYRLLSDYKKGLRHLSSLGIIGLTAFFDYATIKEISEIISLILRCSNELGLIDEAKKLDNLFDNFYPMVPSSAMLCQAAQAAGKEISPAQIQYFRKEYLAERKTRYVEVHEIVSCILSICNCALK